MRYLFLIPLLLFAPDARAIILDTLRAFEDAKPGFQGAIKADFSAKGGNSERLELGGSSRLQWQGDRHRVRALVGGLRATGQGKTLEDEAVAHLRHNYRLRGPLHSILFTQFQHSPLQDLRSRVLVGLGGRLDLWTTERWQAEIGATHMWEWEEVEREQENGEAQRLSSFLSLRAGPRESTMLRVTAFAQPLWSDWGDFRSSATASLVVPLHAHFKLILGAGVEHDSRPPSGIDETDWGTNVGVEWSFKPGG